MPAEGAALIGIVARSRGALCGAGHSHARVPQGCQNALCQEGLSLSQLLGDFFFPSCNLYEHVGRGSRGVIQGQKSAAHPNVACNWELGS